MRGSNESIELKLVASFFLVTGLYGCFNALISISANQDLLPLVFHIFLGIVFGITALSGYFIFKENPKGLEYARAIAALQIVHFFIGGIGYYFVTGAYIFAGINFGEFGLRFGFDNGMFINVGADPDIFALRINMLAIGVFVYLSRLLNKLDMDQEQEDES